MLVPIDLTDKFEQATEYYTPKQIAAVNGTALKIAKFKGAFTWHIHEDSNELFWVVRGRVQIQMKTTDGEVAVTIGENQLFSVPHGIEHKPAAEEEAWVALLEPEEMLNTGNVLNEFTVSHVEKI